MKSDKQVIRLQKVVHKWIAANGPGGWINDLRVENARLRRELAEVPVEFEPEDDFERDALRDKGYKVD